jgi:hypothetical protein
VGVTSTPPVWISYSPTIAADDQGRLAVWYYEGNADPGDGGVDQFFNIRFQGNVAPQSPGSLWQTATLRPQFSPPNAQDFRYLGEYEAMPIRNALGLPSCGAAGTFYPVWSHDEKPNPDGSVLEQVETTRVDITP